MLITKNDVGKKFRCRDGKIVTMIEWDDEDNKYPVFASGEWYTTTGIHICNYYGCIVERIDDDAKTKVNNKQELVSILKHALEILQND